MTQTTAASFAVPRIASRRDPDGTVRLWSLDQLAAGDPSLLHAFRRGSDQHPERLLAAERTGDAGWQRLTWGAARSRVDRLAQGLLDRGLADRPVMILSANSIAHLLVMLAAWTVGAPVVPTSVAYSLQTADHAKLRSMAELADPGTVFAEGDAYAPALTAIGTRRHLIRSAADLAPLEAQPTDALERRAAAVTPDTLAKILFTSGSTGTPKGVLNPHRMLAANQQQIRQIWPFLADEPPILLDWLPWSHTFGGNHNLGLVLAAGGSLWIDDGRPAPALVGRTVRNLEDVRPTLYFNVPAGWAALVPLLERDDQAAERFFADLRLGFFAAAALPQQLWERIGALAAHHGSAMRMTTSYGLTESAPCATSAHFASTRSDCLGVPIPGVEVKLAPVGDKTEIRLRGVNVTPGYHRRPDLGAAALDDEGFLRTGDAADLVDPADPAKGLVFRGRIAEDFKLATGTFVSVGTLRPALLSAAGGLLQDAVLCGQDGLYVGALAWLAPDHDGRRADPALREELRRALAGLAATGGGSSRRVERLLLLTDPPALDAGEITDKGYLNQRAVRDRRAADVERLLADPCPPDVIRRPAEGG